MLVFLFAFFETSKGKGRIRNINAQYENNETIFVCRGSLNILSSYSYSFLEIRNILIQYFAPAGECNLMMIAGLNQV